MESVRNRGRLAKGCWGVAGIPIVASFIQAAIVLVGVSAFELPVVGTVTSLLQTITVLDAAAVVFRNSPSAVLLLFVLVLAGWIVEGIAAFVLRNRTLGYGAAGFVTLFFALFLLVYSPLFSADVPGVELAAFVFVPVVASAASWGAVLTYDWSVTLDEETAETLTAVTERVKAARDAFEEPVRRRVGNSVREQVRPVAPTAVETLETRLEAFRAECDDVLDEAERLRDGTEQLDSRERLQRAEQVLTRAENLDPEAAADEAITSFTDALANDIRDEFGDVHIASTYGREYELRNFREYNELRFQVLGRTAQLGGERHDLADQLVAAIDDGVPLSDVARAVDRANQHVDALRAAIERQEEAFVEVANGTQERLDTVRELTDSFDGSAGGRLSEFLVEGRFDGDDTDVPSVVEIEDTLREGRDDLHVCRFDDATQRVENARDDAERLVAIAEFFANSVGATIEQQVGSVPIPPDIPPELAAQMSVTVEETYSVNYAVDGDTIVLDYEGDPDTTDRARQTTESTAGGPVATTDGADVNVDDVLYLLRELRDAASTTSSEDTVALQTGQVPEKYTTEEIVATVESFASRHSDVAEVSVREDAPPGFFEIVVGDTVSPKSVVNELYDEYLEANRS